MQHVVFAQRKLSFGGGERVMVERVAALADLPLRVSILFRKEKDKRDFEPELRRRNPRVGEILHLPGAWGCFHWLRRNRPDLLMIGNHKGVIRALPWLNRLGPRISTFVTLHEHYGRHLGKYDGIRAHVDRWIIDWDFQEAVRQRLGNQPCTLIHPLYPREIHSPISPERRREARRALGLPEEGLVVGYVGQIDARKAPHSVLKLAEGLDPAALVFAGREEEATARKLEAAIQASPLRDRVLRLGAVPATGPVLDALDAYLMASRNEGFFPIALLEAMERGVPVVVPTVGGIRTVLRDGEGGFLMEVPDDRQDVPPAVLAATAQRLRPIMDDPAAWQAQREKASALARRLQEDYDAAGRYREMLGPYLAKRS